LATLDRKLRRIRGLRRARAHRKGAQKQGAARRSAVAPSSATGAPVPVGLYQPGDDKQPPRGRGTVPGGLFFTESVWPLGAGLPGFPLRGSNFRALAVPASPTKRPSFNPQVARKKVWPVSRTGADTFPAQVAGGRRKARPSKRNEGRGNVTNGGPVPWAASPDECSQGAFLLAGRRKKNCRFRRIAKE